MFPYQDMSFTPLRSNRGFTLIETIMTVAIMVLVGGALSSMIYYVYRSNGYVLQETKAVQSAQQGLRVSLQNLRETSYGDDGSFPLSSAGTSTVTFYADTNNDGAVEKVRLYLSKGSLYRGITFSSGNPPSYTGQTESSSTIATYVINTGTLPIFQYSDANGNALTGTIDPSQVAYVTVTLKIDVDPNRSPTPYTLLGSATLRNLR